MIKASRNFILKYEDQEAGLILTKSYKELTEYWVYKRMEAGMVGLDDMPIQRGEKYLHCIIVCGAGHVTNKKPKNFQVEGVRFTNDEHGNDLQNYLVETGRN